MQAMRMPHHCKISLCVWGQLEIGEAPKSQRPAKWAPPTSPTAAAWRHELHPTATGTIPLQSILDQGKARGSWKVRIPIKDLAIHLCNSASA